MQKTYQKNARQKTKFNRKNNKKNPRNLRSFNIDLGKKPKLFIAPVEDPEENL